LRRSPRYRSRIAPWASGSTRSSSQRASLVAENLVRDARVCQGRHVVCFFQSGQKFKTRYATLGFSDKANLDEGQMWPTAFALTELTSVEEAKICALLKKAVMR